MMRKGLTIVSIWFAAALVGGAWFSQPAAAPPAKTVPGTVMTLSRSSAGLAEPEEKLSARPPAFFGRPSPKNLLGLERDNKFGLARAALQEEKVLKMLAIRVEFVQEDPDDPNTTGDGTFDMRDSVQYKEEMGHLFDAAPHDSAYFGKHIEALSRYWHTVSNGMVSIEGAVYPPEPQGAYTLPNTMAYYGAQPPEYGLGEFYFDAIHTADLANPEINFSAYDVFCVFHAGSDRQNDIGFPLTQHDLFTGFILLGQPIPVDGGRDSVTEGMIVPETSIQDNRIVVMNAVMAHEFGHQLGLVDLYSTQTFISQVGNFSLMDNNAGNVGGEIEVDERLRLLFGSLPVYPDAWSRAYLGMVQVDTVRANPQAFVSAAEWEGSPGIGPQVVLVPITDREYFLIENRQTDIDKDAFTAILADSVTNVILGPVNEDTVFTRDYDYLLPGNGILIWHVDETVALDDVFPEDDIPNNFEANTLQWNFDRRFLSLVEADMIVSFRGTEFSDLGSYTDMFSAPGRRFFTPDTPIPTNSNSGARTGITIEILSPAGNVMDFSVANDQTLPGFPVWCGTDSAFSPSVFDIDTDGTPEVFVGCGHRILGWNFDGTPLFDNQIIDTVISFNGDTVMHKVAVVITTPTPLATPPLVSFIDGTGEPNIVVADDADSIHVWRMRYVEPDWTIDTIYNARSEFHVTGPAAVLDRPGSFIKQIAFGLLGGVLVIDPAKRDSTRYDDVGTITGLAGAEVGNVYYLRPGEISGWVLRKLTDFFTTAVMNAETVYGPVMGDLDRDNSLDVICTGSDGTIWAFDSSLTALPGFPVNLGYGLSSAPVLGDVDADGFLEIIATGDNVVLAVNFNGTLASDYPVEVGRHVPAGPLTHSPIIIDPPGERSAEILVLTAGGELKAVYPPQFNQPEPLARPVGVPGRRSPAFAYDADSQTAAVFALGGDGYLYGYSLPDAPEPARSVFGQEGYDAGRTYVFPIDSLGELHKPGELLAESSVYAWPNPVAGDEVNIRVHLGTAAEIVIAIYDVAGNFIEQLQQAGEGNTENDIPWRCGDVASGVYFCRVEARTATGESSVAFCPVAIAR